MLPNEEAMQSNDDAKIGLEEMATLLDDLALHMMVKGAKAFTAKPLRLLAELADKLENAELAAEARKTASLLGLPAFTAEVATAALVKMQAFLEPQALLQPAATEPVVEIAVVTPPPPSAALFFEEDPEILADFVLESNEHLIAIEENILLLEKDPSLIDKVHTLFRAFHSIKGLAGFLGLSGVQAVAHEVETLLDHARNLRVSVTSAVVDLVLESSEYLKEEVERVQAKLNKAPLPDVRENAALIATLGHANEDVAAGRPVGGVVVAEAVTTPLPAPSKEEEPTLTPVAVFPSPADAPGRPAVVPSQPVGDAPVVSPKARVDAIATSIRVEVSKLDKLMDMVGEMVIAQSILSNTSRSTSNGGDARVAGEISQLVRITGEVQRCAMSMRMMPIGPLFQKNAKMVRDLSRRNGKQVSLQLSGEKTELDKTIAEELADPLMHMIRNALDHGIETPSERLATGKPPVATLKISAEHEAGQIVISISDDGRGLDPKKIFKKAVQNKLVDENAKMTQDEIFRLIFAPGFSTAEKITDISGRGVGMDVVRQHVESLRGRIEIESELGKGTTFYIHLPLTLAIIEGLVVVVGAHRYIVPIFSVREMFRPTPEMLFTVQGRDEMILMRGELLPLIRLHKRFGIEPRTQYICEGLLVVCEFGSKQFCLFVDEMLGRQEIVIKSLDEAFKKVKGLAGSAILGDGRIGLILDVAGIFNSASAAVATHAVTVREESLAA